mmetsp:Transcript_92263/g.134878  ORF Transcript_92263/g.134878 Transcript_92263/m.134878 type:complete len:97 (-) Transcript_92263:220-510(-)
MSTQSYQSLSIYHPPILELRHSTFLGQQECDLSILGNIPLPVAVQRRNKTLPRKQMLRRGMFLFLAHHFTCGATFLFLTPDSSTTTSSSFSFFASS